MAQQATPAQDGTMLHTAQIIHSVIERLDNMDSRRTQQETEVRACRSHRELILDLAKRTTTCSGADPASFRRWITDIELVSSYSSNSSALLEVAVRTATGPLRVELERLLTYFSHATNPPTDRHLVSWDAVKEALQKSFLPLDEEENLRDLLDSTKQGSNKTLASFVRRFRSLANSAYPCETRNADQQRLMLKSFARGIKSAEVAKKLVGEHAPQSIETAYDIAMCLGANQLAYDRLGRREEPMEISPVAQVSGSLSAANSTNNTPDLIASIASALHNQMQNLMTVALTLQGRPVANFYMIETLTTKETNVQYLNVLDIQTPLLGLQMASLFVTSVLKWVTLAVNVLSGNKDRGANHTTRKVIPP